MTPAVKVGQKWGFIEKTGRFIVQPIYDAADDLEDPLAMVTLDDKGMKIQAQVTLNDAPTWTPPTLLDTTLYMRDESRIAAYDLSPKAASK